MSYHRASKVVVVECKLGSYCFVAFDIACRLAATGKELGRTCRVAIDLSRGDGFGWSEDSNGFHGARPILDVMEAKTRYIRAYSLTEFGFGCLQHGVWATEVLEGLAKQGLPTRAEVTDAGMSSRAE